MAHKKRKSHRRKGAHCRTMNVKGQGRRRICWRANGKIKSNRKA